jgi:hypothetical protein
MKDCVFLKACQYQACRDQKKVNCESCKVYITKERKDYLTGCAEVMREQYKEGVNQDVY